MDHDRPARITLSQFTASFVPFGALMVWALTWPEFTNDLDLNRTKLTIWATTILLAPALALYPYRSASRTVFNLASLFWTMAYVAFMVHAYWATFIVFDGITDTFRQQGTLIASVNFFLTVAWTVDVVLLWLVPGGARWLGPPQNAFRVFTFLVFAVTLLTLRGGPVRVLGIAFAVIVVGALALRIYAREGATDVRTGPERGSAAA